MSKPLHRRLVDILGEEEAEQFFARLTGAPTMVDCILIEWLLRPRGRRRAPLVVREQIVAAVVRTYTDLIENDPDCRKPAYAASETASRHGCSYRTVERYLEISRRRAGRIVTVDVDD
jgi:hypothetical protein